MKNILLILLFAIFSNADDKVKLDSTLLPPLNYEIFDSKIKLDNLKKKKKEIDINTMIVLLTEEESNLVKTIRKNSK